MNFENQIQQWVSTDNQIKLLNEKLKELRDKKTEISNDILNYAKNHFLCSGIVMLFRKQNHCAGNL